jgi:uncharacterized cofD-like protein
MKIIDWLRPGINVKRWVLLGIMGILLIFFGLLEVIRTRLLCSVYYSAFYFLLIGSGIFTVYITVIQGMKSIIALMNKGYLNVSLNSRKLENLIYEKRLLVKGPKIVAIGGGTGLSTMLRGLKTYTSNITAIVTVADDGGGSGDLREDLGMLAPGDIRNCILALADTEPLMEELIQYRFTDGRLKNQSFGNLLLAAMDGISNTFEEAVQKMSSVLAVVGKVLPVTLDDVVLNAKLKDGTIIEGESNIPKVSIEKGSQIEKVFLTPENAVALTDAVKAIREADAIILGPGSLYTSVIANLLVKDIPNAIQKSSALKLYISNIMTQPGETEGYGVEDHIKAIFNHSINGLIDYVIVNVGKIDAELESKYKLESSGIVSINEKKIREMNVNIIEGDFIQVKNGLIRHNSDKLASILIETIMDKQLLSDRKKIIEYFYLSQRLKENKISRE